MTDKILEAAELVTCKRYWNSETRRSLQRSIEELVSKGMDSTAATIIAVRYDLSIIPRVIEYKFNNETYVGLDPNMAKNQEISQFEMMKLLIPDFFPTNYDYLVNKKNIEPIEAGILIASKDYSGEGDVTEETIALYHGLCEEAEFSPRTAARLTATYLYTFNMLDDRDDPDIHIRTQLKAMRRMKEEGLSEESGGIMVSSPEDRIGILEHSGSLLTYPTIASLNRLQRYWKIPEVAATTIASSTAYKQRNSLGKIRMIAEFYRELNNLKHQDS